MADPNSAVTKLRLYLARRIQPRPDPGEGWCEGCSLNGGRTLVFSVDGMAAHVRQHGTERIRVQTARPAR
jgi:hypothetical protein